MLGCNRAISHFFPAAEIAAVDRADEDFFVVCFLANRTNRLIRIAAFLQPLRYVRVVSDVLGFLINFR